MIAAHASQQLDVALFVVSGEALAGGDRELLRRLWERDAILNRAMLLIELSDDEPPEVQRIAIAWVDRVVAPIMLSVRESLSLPSRRARAIIAPPPTAPEQRRLWSDRLAAHADVLGDALEFAGAHFAFDAADISGVARELDLARDRQPDAAPADLLWRACREHNCGRFGQLAERLETTAAWSDLILPPAEHATLRAIAAHLRRRTQVYESWGFAGHGRRGLGVSALFAGPSGTGKTLAAEVLGSELGLSVCRVDLSRVVSKYIGETEKNLRRVFDAAEESGAILLFDEADALFGKRSEVRDSHDRYANIEVSYLLQKMESYRGLAILTTNMKDALDQAFLRRLRFIVKFPFPDSAHRERIWQRVFPAETPRSELDVTKLARLTVTGGSIRNIALNAAFMAADSGGMVSMRHLYDSARAELGKLEKTLNEQEVRDWI